MKTTAKIAAMLLVFGLWGGIASAIVITLDFEDLTLGQSYNVGDSFTTSDVLITVEQFQEPEGNWYTYGDVTVDTDTGLGFNTAGGSGNELGVSGVNLYFDFDTTLIGLELLYGDFGGNLNIELNGDFVNFGNFINIDNTTIGGTSISTLDNGIPGQSTGTLSVVGTIQSFRIGGAELWIDNVTVIPRPPTTYYVNAAEGSDNNDGLSPETPFATIQKAIDSAYDGDTVIVADGTYTGPGNRDIDFLGKAITVRSENGPENCIIDCNGTEDDRHRGFYFDNGEDANSVLEGFTITNGYAQQGGGIYCMHGSSPTITNCTITDNIGYWGGGIYCWESSPTITNCTITGNSGDDFGGGIFCYNSNPAITNCIISGNSAYEGGGIYCRGSRPTITKCTIIGNTAAMGAGIYCCESSPTITNCTITGNSSGAGGGISCDVRSNPTITNCTITGNSAGHAGGGIWGSLQSNITISNCILWANEALYGPQISLEENSNAWVSYTDVQGDQNDVYIDQDCTLNWGPGNINFDPCFVNPGYWDTNYFWVDGDYHLLRTSPCVDSGDNNSVPADIHDLDGDGNTAEPLPFDLDGNPRFVDRPDIEDTGNGTPPIVDMGAYEAMVSCFGVNHVKLGTKAGKKGNKVELKGTFDPASPIDFAVDDVTYTIDDGLDYMLTFVIPAGSFKVDGKPDKQKFRFHSAKGSQPGIKAKFDFLKCKFELKVKGVMDTSEITADTLAIVLQAGANLVEEVVQVQAKPKHLEFKRKPKLNCCQM